MTWSSAFPKSPRLLPLAAAVIAALSASGLAQAQVANGLPIVNSVPDISIVTGIPGNATPAPEPRKRKSEKNCPQTAEAETMLGSLDRVMYMINDVEVTQCETD